MRHPPWELYYPAKKDGSPGFVRTFGCPGSRPFDSLSTAPKGTTLRTLGIPPALPNRNSKARNGSHRLKAVSCDGRSLIFNDAHVA